MARDEALMVVNVSAREDRMELGRATAVHEHPVVALYVADRARLVRTATLLLGDREAAEDVVQEAFVRLDRRAADLPDVRSRQAYVRQIVVNLSRSALRRRVVALKHLPRPSVPAPAADGEALASLEHDEVVRALRRLSTRQRQALVLRFYEDLSEAEVAEAMGCKVGTVKATLSQAKQALARLLELDRRDEA
jgi:RNA polymerase sigma-70 factor (sigma-E family)